MKRPFKNTYTTNERHELEVLAVQFSPVTVLPNWDTMDPEAPAWGSVVSYRVSFAGITRTTYTRHDWVNQNWQEFIAAIRLDIQKETGKILQELCNLAYPNEH